jgi:hypothetical protein
LQHCVPQELQTLVGLHWSSLFVRHRRMRQREAQQTGIAEDVAKISLERAVVGHVRKIQASKPQPSLEYSNSNNYSWGESAGPVAAAGSGTDAGSGAAVSGA